MDSRYREGEKGRKGKKPTAHVQNLCAGEEFAGRAQAELGHEVKGKRGKREK
jgi:hypothetical protein